MDEIVLSPSQIETWLLCPRKWGWDKLEGKPRPQHPSTQVGTRVHKILELYLGQGIAPDRYEKLRIGKQDYYPGRIALSMVPHLPPAGSCLPEELEAHFRTEIDGIKFQGYKDLRKPGKVYDHKTTGDLKWAGEKDLRTDPQALIYAWDEMTGGPSPIPSADVREQDDSGPIQCQWTYGQTKGKERAKAVKVSLSPEEICKGLEEIVLPAARQIIEARTKRPAVKDLAYNVKACDKYGGCPYLKDCNLTGKERIKGIMNREELLAKVRAKKGAPAPAETTPAPEPAPAAPSAALARLKARKAASLETAPVKATGINPPGEAEQTESYKQAKETGSVEATGKVAENPESKPAKSNAKRTFTLFVDCEPVQWPGNTIRLEALITPAAEQVCEDLEVPHYRLIDFGKGPGCLSAQLKDNLSKAALPEGTALLMTLRTNEGRDCFQCLYELAANVVVGR